MIKYGLKDKSFLFKKATKPSQLYDSVEKKHLVPEEEKKQKEIKIILKKMQESLAENKFEEACTLLKSILEKKNPDWLEVSLL